MILYLRIFDSRRLSSSIRLEDSNKDYFSGNAAGELVESLISIFKDPKTRYSNRRIAGKLLFDSSELRTLGWSANFNIVNEKEKNALNVLVGLLDSQDSPLLDEITSILRDLDFFLSDEVLLALVKLSTDKNRPEVLEEIKIRALVILEREAKKSYYLGKREVWRELIKVLENHKSSESEMWSNLAQPNLTYKAVKKASRSGTFCPYNCREWPDYPVNLHLAAGYGIGRFQLKSSNSSQAQDYWIHSPTVGLGVDLVSYFSMSAYYQYDNVRAEPQILAGAIHRNNLHINTVGGQVRATLPLHFVGITGVARLGKPFYRTGAGNDSLVLPGQDLVELEKSPKMFRWSLGAYLSTDFRTGMGELLSIGYQYTQDQSRKSLQDASGNHFNLSGKGHQLMIFMNPGPLLGAWLELVFRWTGV